MTYPDKVVTVCNICGEEFAIVDGHLCEGKGKLVKESNPKDVIGSTKIGLSNVPLGPLFELAAGMTEGAIKYGRHNYRAIGVRSSIYFDAAIRHLFAWWEGEDFDPDSRIHHLAKAMCCLVIVRDAQMNGKCVDDRPPKTEVTNLFIKKMSEHVEMLLKQYPEPKPPYTEIPL
jgi:hypothetical protein